MPDYPPSRHDPVALVGGFVLLFIAVSVILGGPIGFAFYQHDPPPTASIVVWSFATLALVALLVASACVVGALRSGGKPPDKSV